MDSQKVDSQKVDNFLMSNAKFFDNYQARTIIREKLIALSDSKFSMICSLEFKDPTTTLIVSILAGSLGVDRFMIGDIGLGIGKFLTCGGLGIWTIVDWFMIQKATKEKNMQKMQQFWY